MKTNCFILITLFLIAIFPKLSMLKSSQLYSFSSTASKKQETLFHTKKNKTSYQSTPIPFADSLIINDYTPVINFDPCANQIIVEDGSAFHVGDTVLIIQMKGAAIDSSNTALFGSVTNYKNAGNYEFNYIKSVNGNTLELLNILTRQYDITDGKVQLVRVPYFINYNPQSTLTCLPWDGAKGGVLVFNVQNELTLNYDINVSSRGFRGGFPLLSSLITCNKTDYYYPALPNDGAHKGEGIADISVSKIYGRGALANGGGGGNAHNAGGAGGGNGGRGGTGGDQYSLLEQCSNFIAALGGVSGNQLPYSNIDNKVFLGGGGGAGHTNEFTDKPGGSGGGLMIISANSVRANGHSIISNGGNVTECTAQTVGCANDGHSGGGAGGTILLEVNQFVSLVNIQANGGKGADAWRFNSSIYPHGPGGGGAGGVIWLSQPTTPTNINSIVTGGANGVVRQHSNISWGSTPGQAGLLLHGLRTPVDGALFQKSIDSVRIKDIAISCSVFDFKGLAYPSASNISTWEWDLGDGTTANTQDVTHRYTTIGIFSVKLRVTDPMGCKDSISIAVNVTSLSVDFSFTPDDCNPLAIRFIAEGNPALPVFWSFGDGNTNTTSASPLHLFPAYGTYTVRYSPNTGTSCNDTITKQITLQRPGIGIIQNNDTAICAGNPVPLLASGLQSYSWSPATGLSNPSIPNPIATPLFNTQYVVTGINLAGCEVTDTINIIVNPLPVLTVTADTTICAGNPVQLLASGADTYSWSPASGLSGTTIANPVANPIATIPYTVTGSSQFGCEASATVNIIVTPKPVITITPDTTICLNSSVPLAASGGSAYSWSPVDGLDNSAIPNPIATPVATTKYHVVVTDDLGCTNTDSVTVSLYPQPVFTLTPNSDLCLKDTLQLQATGGDIYAWQANSSLSNSNTANPFAYPLMTTTYTVDITETTCNNTAQLSTTIAVLPLPTIHISKQNDIDCSNDKSQLSATGAVKYTWTPVNSLSNPAIYNPVARPISTTQYTVTGTGSNGCINTDSVTVKVELANKSGYLLPNAFSPNGDGLNDCFGIRLWGVIEELEFSIFNRWGERIFFTNNPSDCWDGTYKGVKQDNGIFVYMIRANTFCEKNIFRKGTFTLIR